MAKNSFVEEVTFKKGKQISAIHFFYKKPCQWSSFSNFLEVWNVLVLKDSCIIYKKDNI